MWIAIQYFRIVSDMCKHIFLSLFLPLPPRQQ
jgi:hypothetical protein